jgi:hypothetical protein
MNLRLGPLAVSVLYSTVSYGVAVHKWQYIDRCSWRHGTLYCWRFKVIW